MKAKFRFLGYTERFQNMSNKSSKRKNRKSRVALLTEKEWLKIPSENIRTSCVLRTQIKANKYFYHIIAKLQNNKEIDKISGYLRESTDYLQRDHK